MYTYRPDKIVELDATVRRTIKLQRRAQQTSEAALAEASRRLARSKRTLDAWDARLGSARQERDLPPVS